MRFFRHHRFALTDAITARRSFRCFTILTALIVVLCATAFQVNAQAADNSALSSSVRSALNARQESFLQEEIYVHTDREVYLPGDICWFRIYAVDAVLHRPVNVSKIAYVDLVDANGKSWVQEKVSLRPGEQGNSFVLPVGLPSGNYTLRAYTRWMKNGSSEWFFHKTLQVVNPNVEDSVTPAPADSQRLDIQFFPEGGNLVKGIASRVAYRVTDAYGRGLSFSGWVTGTNGDTMARFHPEKLGIDHFEFTPADTFPARVLLHFPDGRVLFSQLPAAFQSGFVMRVDTLAGTRRLQVTVTSAGMADRVVFLAVHTRGTFKYGRTEKLVSGSAVFSLDRDSLDAGIAVFTLLAEGGAPVCERLYFTYSKQQIDLNTHTLDEYGIRKRVDLDISVNREGKPATADLSVAVYRPDLPGEYAIGNGTDIRSYLWLTGDLGHAVESAGLYFSDTVSNRPALMDNLMLTQGWRRFSWKDLFSTQRSKPIYGPEFNGHIIETRMLDAATGRPRKDDPAYISVPGPYTRFRITQTDSSGKAVFEMPWFYNSDEIVLQTDASANAPVHFEMNSPFAPIDNSGFAFLPPGAASVQPDNLIDEHVRNQVQRIYTGTQMRQFDPPAVDTGFFYGSPDEKYVLDDFVRFTTMEEVLREYVVSVNVFRRKGKLQVSIFDTENRKFFDSSPLLLIDGIPVFDQEKLFRYDPLKIRRLDLLTRPYFMGFHRFEGVINLVTYRGNLDGFEMDPAANVLEYPGINAQREFYSPRYETEEAVASRLPDFRSSLFWTPQLIPGADGTAQVSFYTSDIPGNYVVVIEGLSPDGLPAAKTVRFTVRK